MLLLQHGCFDNRFLALFNILLLKEKRLIFMVSIIIRNKSNFVDGGIDGTEAKNGKNT